MNFFFSHGLTYLPTPVYQNVGTLAHFSLHCSANIRTVYKERPSNPYPLSLHLDSNAARC